MSRIGLGLWTLVLPSHLQINIYIVVQQIQTITAFVTITYFFSRIGKLVMITCTKNFNCIDYYSTCTLKVMIVLIYHLQWQFFFKYHCITECTNCHQCFACLVYSSRHYIPPPLKWLKNQNVLIVIWFYSTLSSRFKITESNMLRHQLLELQNL